MPTCPEERGRHPHYPRHPSTPSPDARRQAPIQPGGNADPPPSPSPTLWSASLTDILHNGAKSLQCPDLGMRFTVQDTRFGNSKPMGNFEVEQSMIVETFNNLDYFAGELAFWRANGASSFSKPLLVDFFLRPGSPPLRKKRELDQVLTESQVGA